jgi:hypothetical protein
VRRNRTGSSTDRRAWERLSLPLAIGAAALTFVLAAPARAEEPLWGESASTLGQGFLSVTTNGGLQQSRPYFHHGGRVALQIDRVDVGTSVEYGLLPDLDLRLHLSYFNETITESLAGQSTEQPLAGMGEARLGAKWRFRQWITGRHKDELALLVELKLPTGDAELRDRNGEVITPHLQPNSGHLGGTVGIALNRHTRWGGYWLSGMASIETASFRYGRGEMLELHASAGRRVRAFTNPDRTDWMGIVGLHYQQMGEDSEFGRTIRDSGGSVISAEIGLIGTKRNRGVRLGILLPVHTDVGQAHAPPRREIQASVHASF